MRSGFIRVFANANDKEVTQWISTKGYFITDLYSFTFKQRAKWNIQALTDCELYTIDKENYDTFEQFSSKLGGNGKTTFALLQVVSFN